MKGMQRLFIAIPFTPGIKKNLVKLQDELKPRLTGWRWATEETFHLTLKFIGEVRVEDVADFCAIAEDAVQGLDAFEFKLTTLGVFPRVSGAKVLWAGVGGEIAPIVEMAKRLEESAADLGITPENRAYHPHITLARAQRGEKMNAEALQAEIDRLANLEIAKVFCREIIVYNSVLKSEGPTHIELATAKLAPR